MNEKEFKEYVDEINKNIADKLKDNDEELAFYVQLVKRFNDICEEKLKLKQALDEIEKWLKEKAEQMDIFNITQRKETGAFWFSTRGNIDDLLQIIKKAKGE